MPPQKKLTGIRYAAFVASFVGVTVLAIYPIVIKPMISTDEYKEIQATARRGLNQEDIQPGNMRVWRDPFDRKLDK